MKGLFGISVLLAISACGLDLPAQDLAATAPLDAQGLLRPSGSIDGQNGFWLLRLSKDKLFSDPISDSRYILSTPENSSTATIRFGVDGQLYLVSFGKAYAVGRYQKPVRFEQDAPVNVDFDPRIKFSFKPPSNFWFPTGAMVVIKLDPDLRPVPTPPRLVTMPGAGNEEEPTSEDVRVIS